MKSLAAAALALLAAAPCLAAGLTCPASVVDKDGKGSALLFSALPLGGTKFAKTWGKARKELAKEFPGLRFEKPENLHVTLAFMGAGWDPVQLSTMEALGLEGPDLSSGAVTLKGSPDLFGGKKEVVALALGPVSDEWSSRLIKNRDRMTELGLRKRDRFDYVFKPHVSLASAPKPDEQREELERFRKWIGDRAKRFGGLEFAIDRAIKPQYLLVQGKDETLSFPPLRAVCAPAAP